MGNEGRDTSDPEDRTTPHHDRNVIRLDTRRRKPETADHMLERIRNSLAPKKDDQDPD